MAWWSFMSGSGIATVAAQPVAVVSPFAAPNHLETAIVGDIFGEVPNEAITVEIALRVPEVKRALQLHTSLIAPLAFEVYKDGKRLEEQPYWVSSSDYPITSPYLTRKGIATDLFLFGWALAGAELDPVTDLPRDIIHIPRAFWELDQAKGRIEVNEAIPLNYRQRLILVPLGTNGILTDGIDSIRQARKLELARQRRLDAPPPSTELHLTEPKYDEMTRDEQMELAKNYADARAKYSTSVTKSYMQVKDAGTNSIDLFESGMNSLRLQLAMHAGVPASALEAGKEGGGAGQMTYSNEDDRQGQLWQFGSSEIAYAIAARLSQSDVVGPDAEVRADLSSMAVPAPTQLAPEFPIQPESVAAPAAPTE